MAVVIARGRPTVAQARDYRPPLVTTGKFLAGRGCRPLQPLLGGDLDTRARLVVGCPPATRRTDLDDY
jgi:hypothetical protein